MRQLTTPWRISTIALLLLLSAGLWSVTGCGSDTDKSPPTQSGEAFPDHAATGVRTPLSLLSGTIDRKAGALPYKAEFWADKQVDEAGTITFASSDAATQALLKPGVVLGVPLPTGGDVRRVTTVTTAGSNILIHTESAPIGALMDNANLKIEVGGDAAKTDLVDPWVDVDLAGKTLADKSGDDWGLKLEVTKGRFAGNPKFSMNLVISRSSLHLFEVTSAGFFVLEMRLKLSGKAEKSFTKSIEIPLVEREILAVIGGVPVWISPYVKLEVKGAAKLDAKGELTAGFRSTIPGSLNMKWALAETPHWSTSSVGRLSLFPLPVKIAQSEVAAEAKLTLTAFVGVKLYRAVSMEIEAAAWTQVAVKAGESCTYALTAGGDGQATIKLDGFGAVEDKAKSKTLFELKKTLTTGACLASAGPDVGTTAVVPDWAAACVTQSKTCQRKSLLCCDSANGAQKKECLLKAECKATYDSSERKQQDFHAYSLCNAKCDPPAIERGIAVCLPISSCVTSMSFHYLKDRQKFLACSKSYIACLSSADPTSQDELKVCQEAKSQCTTAK